MRPIKQCQDSPPSQLRAKPPALYRSVAGRFIQSSLWPSILSCDTSAGRGDGVQSRVRLSTLVATLAALLITVAGIVTPIGLGESIVAGPFVTAKFSHAIDSTPFGSETTPRDLYFLSRVCGGGRVPCPGVNPDYSAVTQGLYGESNTVFASYVLPSITDRFTGGFGDRGDLRTTPFEIQYRQYQTYSTEEYSKSGNPAKRRISTTGIFTIVETLVLLDKIVIREGVIADLVNGGIGFRNHTVPITPRMPYGAQWTEDILWLEPVTACIDTNWSIETDLRWVNRGGGIIPTQFPDRKLPRPPSQLDPQLRSRAHIAGSVFNYRLSQLLRLSTSNATVGSTYDLPDLNIWAMTSFSDLDDHKGLMLGPLRDPFKWHQPPRHLPSRIKLDPAQFNLASFDVNAFNRYYASIIAQENTTIRHPDITMEDACKCKFNYPTQRIDAE